ncbi:MAG TPA: metalloregulator ArsR/SmtB family transcription factor [Pyrinomonadaceae bacterium]|jgi:ArsR family transcriptional regulator, arsenate/arsenite/antimonite-responsive transcriptional repressor|nr:metalloregulator ArsR/SmtB family transcription factor [Pyrinomonadaceae bacterium]
MARANGFDPELFFAALADRTRLRLLNLLRDGEVCTCFFADTLQTNDPKISRHLAYLKRAGLVKGRRDGKWVHYSLVEPKDPAAREIFDATMDMLKSDKSMEQDRKRLVNVCCAPSAPISISRSAQ